VLPGLADAHLHVLATGKARCTVDFRECRSIDDMRAALVAWVAQHPVAEDGDVNEPLLGEGWAQDAMGGRYPTAADFAEPHLPRHIATRPLVLYRACHHICVCNDVRYLAWSSRSELYFCAVVLMRNHHCGLLESHYVLKQVALRLLGIDAARADPPGGRIDRLPNEDEACNASTAGSSTAVNFGRPSGILRETAADLSKALSASTPAARLRYIERGLAECLTAGVTSVQTNDWSAWPQYCALADSDRLPMRVYLTIPAVEIDFEISPKAGETRGSAHRAASLTVSGNAGSSDNSIAHAGGASGGAGPMLECHRVKLFADGSLGASTAALSAPYVEIHRCAQTHAQQRADSDGAAAAADGHTHSHDHSHDHNDNAAAASEQQNSGLLLYTQEQLTAEIRRARDHGFRLEIHVWILDIFASSALNVTDSIKSFSTVSTHSAFL
jgi:predicted amidohydrolase YtcJ